MHIGALNFEETSNSTSHEWTQSEVHLHLEGHRDSRDLARQQFRLMDDVAVKVKERPKMIYLALETPGMSSGTGLPCVVRYCW